MPSPSNHPKRRPHSPAAPQQFELVDPRWLLKALGITFAIALLCTCLTLIWLHHWKQSHPAPPKRISNLASPISPLKKT